MKIFALTCINRHLNQMILTKQHSCSSEGIPVTEFSFMEIETADKEEPELAFFSEKEIELILSKDSQDHNLIRGHLQSHWQRHILDHNEFFDIKPIPIEFNL